MTRPLRQATHLWVKCVVCYPWLIVGLVLIITGFGFDKMKQINVSTHINALMPEDAQSVRVLNTALEKTGSFAAIQIVVSAKSQESVLEYLEQIKTQADRWGWVASSQYYEDIEILEQHKLLQLSLDELLQLETDVDAAYITEVAKRLGIATGTDVRFTLRQDHLTGWSNDEVDSARLAELNRLNVPAVSQKRRHFLSEDGLTGVLLVWPKAGQNSLLHKQAMVRQSYQLVETLSLSAPSHMFIGVGGRIASQVAQFNSIIRDLKVGLASSVLLIIMLLWVCYRSVVAIPVIILPLIGGIVTTLGVTTMTIGTLNLITVFLTLILFGLGIDFAIHNYSRYCEERQAGQSCEAALRIVIAHTGAAAVMAVTTTALSFLALTLTEFRAFSEFGFIAAIGICLICVYMYTLQLALFVLADRWGWRPKGRARSRSNLLKRVAVAPLAYKKTILCTVVVCVMFSAAFAPSLRFETNVKNLEAQMPEPHVLATQHIRNVIKVGNSRAIIVAPSYDGLVKIHNYFTTLTLQPPGVTTVKSVSSLLSYVPDQKSQLERLNVIKRLAARAHHLRNFDPQTYENYKKFLTIETLNATDLPPGLRRTYLGAETNMPRLSDSSSEPGEESYLIYVDTSVNMDDSDQAARFYNEVGTFTVEGQNYASASESFVLVEMLALMKSDAIKAVALVGLTTFSVVFLFCRSVSATIIILVPTILGLALTLGIMGAWGPSLSIMNMVVLPSLIGISVDNAIHIFHRFKNTAHPVDITAIMQTTGLAAGVTTLTTLLGFGGMITASMAGLRSLALLSIIGFISCLVMTWCVLPVVLKLYQGIIVKKHPHFIRAGSCE